MSRPYSTRILFLFAGLLFSSLACSFITGGAPEPAAPVPIAQAETGTPLEIAPTPKAATPLPVEAAPTEPATPAGDPLQVTTLQEVREAVIQIEAQGSFVDPQVGLQMNVPGRGSGFIINEEGLAVTNNHVVTGAALLRVWVGGEGQPLNARVLAVSECSDLALIDLEGDGYRYLPWYEGRITPGLDVYAAGFPLGDPEFTLTRGIVSKAQADGESDWASVDRVIEHDATINPGNSGGPLITAEGQVVGINYAGAQDAGQYFAISRAEALPILQELQEERDVTSIGVNGMAVNDGSLSGIWVASVASGSPADQAGVTGGDIITMLEGLLLATDGTMADYCDILRSHYPDDVLSIEVLRFETETVLEGQLNGRTLEETFSFAQELGDEVGEAETGGDAGPAAPAYEYVSVTDDSGALTMEVPAAWSDLDGAILEVDGEVLGARLAASSDLPSFYASYGTPGAIFIASEATVELGGVDDLLARSDFSEDCVYEGRFDYEDALYAGAYDFYSGCGGSEAILVMLAVFPADRSFAAQLLIQAINDADLAAADHILETFVVVGELPRSSAPAGGGSTDGEVTLEIINETAVDIWYLYISLSSSDIWGDDWLGTEILFAGERFTVSLPPGTYDLRAEGPEEVLIEEVYGLEIDRDMTWNVTGVTGAMSP